MNVFAPMFEINILGLQIDSTIIIQWIVMLLIFLVSVLLTRKLSVFKPNKIQVVFEIGYQGVCGLVNGNMGDEFKNYIPFVGTLMVFLGFLNLTGLIGIEPPTKDLSVVIGFSAITFFLVHYNSIKRKGIKTYIKSYTKPYIPMIVINIIEKLVFPVSLTLRLFGNILAGSIILSLAYTGLSSISIFAQIGFPIIPHAFFDIFDGIIQTIIFVMLTIINIKIESDNE